MYTILYLVIKWDNISVYLMNYLPLSTSLLVVYSTLTCGAIAVYYRAEMEMQCYGFVYFMMHNNFCENFTPYITIISVLLIDQHYRN